MVRSARIMPPAPAYRQWSAPAVALADCKIGDGTGLIAANLEGNDDKIGALQGGFPVAVAADFAVRAHGIHQLAHHDMRLFQPGFIDIHQRDMRRFQRRALENITENILTNTVEPAPIKVIFGADITHSPSGH